MSKLYNQLSTNDECYTPRYGVDPILKWLKINVEFVRHKKPQDITIWCPFDTEKSEYVSAFREAGFKVIHSHIWDGKDFLTYEPEEDYDFIISNPPFTDKRVWVERAIQLRKPFAFLLPATWLNDTAPFNLNVDLDIMMFDKRINFGKPGISFKAIYYSHGVQLGRYIVEKLEVNKNDKSKMWEDLEGIKNE